VPIDFSPGSSVGEEKTVSGRKWTWDGAAWILQASVLGTASVSTADIANSAVTSEKLAASAAIQPTIVDSKGDIIVATAADAVSRLAVGTNGYVLTADSAAGTGVKWGAQGNLPVSTKTSNYTLVASDAGTRVVGNATSLTFTVNNSVFTAGDTLTFDNRDSTALTIAAGAGVTINSAAGLTLAQYQTAQLYCLSASSFVLAKTAVTTSSGAVLQVVSAVKTDTETISTLTYTNITGLTRAITPSSASNKVLVIATVSAQSSGNTTTAMRIARDGTGIFVGDAAGSRTQTSVPLFQFTSTMGVMQPIVFLDSPATTSSVTYSVQVRTAYHTAYPLYINFTGQNDSNASDVGRSASSITCMEVTP
jgi:hypothetical protein